MAGSRVRAGKSQNCTGRQGYRKVKKEVQGGHKKEQV